MPSRNVDSRPLTWRIGQHKRLSRMPDPWAILAFTWIRSAADNLGRIEGDPDLLASQVFPLRRDVPGEDMTEWLGMMHEHGVMFWYVGPDGEQYLQVPPDLWFDLDQKLVGNMRDSSDFPDPPEQAYQEWLAARSTSVPGGTRSDMYKPVLRPAGQSEHVSRREGKGREGTLKGKEEKGLTDADASIVPPADSETRREVAATAETPKAKAAKEKQWTDDQKRLVDLLWQWLKVKDALPVSATKAGGNRFFGLQMTQAAKLLAMKPLEYWQAVFKWATEVNDYWPKHLDTLKQLGDTVRGQYERRPGKGGGAAGGNGRQAGQGHTRVGSLTE